MYDMATPRDAVAFPTRCGTGLAECRRDRPVPAECRANNGARAENEASSLAIAPRPGHLTMRTVAHFPHYIGLSGSSILRANLACGYV